MFYAKINPRTGEAMFVDMDGVPAPDQRAAQRAVQQACLMAEEAASMAEVEAQHAQQAQPVEAPQGGADAADDEELAHVNNVQELRSYEWLQDPLVAAVLEAVRERGERSVSRTIVGRCLQYARMSAARDEALHLSRQALDTAKDYAERARQLSVIVRYELTETTEHSNRK